MREDLDPTDGDLRRFGWAPGQYIIRCRDCPGISCQTWDCDKRAVRCRPYAVKAWRAEPASVAEERAVLDALHGTLLSS